MRHSTYFMLVVFALTVDHQIEADYEPEYIIIIHLKDFKCYFCLSAISNRFKTKPPRRGQPLYKGQMARPQSVLCSEALLYCHRITGGDYSH